MGRAAPELVDLVGRMIAEAPAGRPPRIAIVGAQGCGKTTLAREAADRFGAAQISLDDVYLTRAEREAMARDLHPLFAVRGPPGTHDLGLLDRLIDALTGAGPEDETAIPVFDKRGDDRLPTDRWRGIRGRPVAILIDGWCLGAAAQDEAALARPVNALERDHDPDGFWRRAVNGFVASSYTAFAARLDALLFLKAPGFEVVPDWRAGQEADLLGLAPADLPPADRARVAGFVQYFERLTRHMLAGGVRADVTVALDRNRRPEAIAA